MPYISQQDRKDVNATAAPVTPGELNYMLTCQCVRYIEVMGKKYQHINDVIGVLECMKLEFYRRLVADYEDQKIKENGDVYP